MRRFLTLVTLLGIAAPAAAQPDPPGPADRYFPIAPDNAWTFYLVRYIPPDFAPDTSLGPTWSFGDPVFRDTLEYYPFSYGPIGTIRSDGERIYKLQDTTEVLLFDFTLPDSATYTYEDDSNDPYYFEVLVQRDLVFETHAGRFEDLIKFEFDIPEAIDDHMWFWFAPDVGLVAYFVSQEGRSLYSAVVDGRAITSIEAPPAVHAFSAYPNPFRDGLTVDLPALAAGPGRLVVYDVLGRRVLEQPVAGAASKQVLDLRGQPAGLYLLRLHTGRAIHEQVVVKGR